MASVVDGGFNVPKNKGMLDVRIKVRAHPPQASVTIGAKKDVLLSRDGASAEGPTNGKTKVTLALLPDGVGAVITVGTT